MVIRLGKRTIAVILCIVCLVTGTFALIHMSHIARPAAAAQEDGLKLPIIMYHQISKDSSYTGRYVLPAAQFEKDMALIRQKGYTAITMTQLIAYAYNGAPLPEKPIIITFDDGYESFIPYVLPVLEKYDLCAVISIIGAIAQLYTDTEDHTLRYSHLSWEAIRTLSQNPRVEIQNHTYDMHHLDKGRKGCRIKPGEDPELYKKLLREDLTKVQEEVYRHTGQRPNTFTYPFGAICAQALEVVKDMGFQAVLTCAEKVNIIRGGTEWLYALGRFNREYGKSSEAFFQNIL